MIVEVFDVAHAGDGATGIDVKIGRAVGGHGESCGVAESARFQESGDAATASCVGLQHVDGAGVEHAAEVGLVVAVFSGGDVHVGRSTIADEA